MIKFFNEINKRYYFISVQKDLFDDWVLLVYRGGGRNHLIRTYGYANRSLLDERLNEMINKRIKRGYKIIQ